MFKQPLQLFNDVNCFEEGCAAKSTIDPLKELWDKEEKASFCLEIQAKEDTKEFREALNEFLKNYMSEKHILDHWINSFFFIFYYHTHKTYSDE